MGRFSSVRFKLGLALGFAAGYWAGSRSDEQRRKEVDEVVRRIREDPRLQRVGETMSHGVERLGDAVEQRVAGEEEKGSATPASADPETGSAGERSS
jgi:hypothetical protein